MKTSISKLMVLFLGILFVGLIGSILCSPLEIDAKTLSDQQELKAIEILEKQDYEIISRKTEILNKEQLDNAIIAKDGIDDLLVGAKMETIDVAKDGIHYKAHILSVNGTTKYSIRSTDTLNATICWVDNLGINNQLVYVAASYPLGRYSSDTYYYSYWKTGFLGTTVSGTWSGINLYKTVSNYTGTGFTLKVTVGSQTLQVSTSALD